MNNIEGKRFYAAIVGIFVISVVTIHLKFSAKDYITLFGLAYGALRYGKLSPTSWRTKTEARNEFIQS